MSPLGAGRAGARPRLAAWLVSLVTAAAVLPAALPSAPASGAASTSSTSSTSAAAGRATTGAVVPSTADAVRTRAPRLLTPKQCRRAHARPARERACIKRYRAQRTAARTGQPRLEVGVSFGNTLPWLTASQRRRALDDVVALGARSIRMDVSWSALQQDGPDTYWWQPFDAAISGARARGLGVQVVLTYTPRWAQDPSCTAGEFCPAADPEQFARYAAAVTSRYTPLGVTAYEIWNEPNLAMFWPDPDPQRYRRLLVPTVAAIRSVAPRSRIIFGGLAHQETRDGRLSPADFLWQTCQAGGCGLLDSVAVHPYSFPMLASDTTSWMTPWEHVFRDGPGTRSLVSVLDGLGLQRTTLDINEFGAPTGGLKLAASSGATWIDGVTDHVTERRQAEIVADGIRTAAREPRVASLFVYTDRDGSVRYDPLDRGATYGLRRADGSRKPAWNAMVAAVRALPRS